MCLANMADARSIITVLGSVKGPNSPNSNSTQSLPVNAGNPAIASVVASMVDRNKAVAYNANDISIYTMKREYRWAQVDPP